MLPMGHLGITVAVIRVVERIYILPWADYRLLLIGSILPDLIDKPMGYIFFAHPLVNGRTYGHSLLFLILILSIAFVQWYYRNYLKVLNLGIGTTTHLTFDAMWKYQETLFWPIYGLTFSSPIHDEWVGKITIGMFAIEKRVALEIIGTFLLIYFFISLALKKKLEQFNKTGQML